MSFLILLKVQELVLVSIFIRHQEYVRTADLTVSGEAEISILSRHALILPHALNV